LADAAAQSIKAFYVSTVDICPSFRKLYKALLTDNFCQKPGRKAAPETQNHLKKYAIGALRRLPNSGFEAWMILCAS